jgi:hypothetical protein
VSVGVADVYVANRVSILVQECKASRATWADTASATRIANR